MEKLNKIIGVIGGVGPFAGLDFVSKIFSNTIAVKDQDHLNCILISCPSVIPDRTEFLLENKKEEENPAYGIFECAKRLHLSGACCAIVACNTAHADKIFLKVSNMVKDSLPNFELLNMLKICETYVNKKLAIKELGLLATLGTYKSKVYHEYLKKEDGYNLIEPQDPAQKEVHDAIYNKNFGIKVFSNPVKKEAVQIIKTQIEALVNSGAKAVVLGCTELPLAVEKETFPIPIIDPALIAARYIIEKYAPEKLAGVI